MSSRRNFPSSEDADRMITAIMKIPNLSLSEKYWLGEQIDRATARNTGRQWADYGLRMAAYVMGVVDVWNKNHPDQKLTEPEARRLISKHLVPHKTADALRKAIAEPFYAKQIRAKAVADPDTASFCDQVVCGLIDMEKSA